MTPKTVESSQELTPQPNFEGWIEAIRAELQPRWPDHFVGLPANQPSLSLIAWLELLQTAIADDPPGPTR